MLVNFSGVFIDLKKAFNTVSHAILLNKPSLFRVTGLELDWFRSYLPDRKQATNIVNTILSCRICHVWCPSRLNIGTTYIHMYINDFPNVISKGTKPNL